MGKLIKVKELAKKMELTVNSIQQKIQRGSIPAECVLRLPDGMIRIDLDILRKYKPDFVSQIENVGKFKEKKGNRAPSNLISLPKLAKALNVHLHTIYIHIKGDLYPYIERPTVGKNRRISVLKDETIAKYPQLEKVLKDL